MGHAHRLDDDRVADLFADRGVEGARPWRPPADGVFAAGVYFLGKGNPALEVCVVPASTRPKRDQVRELWKTRQGRQAAPLLLICPFTVAGAADAQVCGPTETDQGVAEVGFDQAVGLAAGALHEPNAAAAVRYLHDHMPSGEQEFAGLRNQGMFANHTLDRRVRERADWTDALRRGAQLRGKEGRDLVEALGFSIEQTNTPLSVLRGPNERARGIAVFLDRGEGYDAGGGRFGETSALSLAFTRAERDNIPFVLLTRGSEIRLYAASGYEGVGRKGQAETFVQANVDLLADNETGYLPLIFSADALQDDGSFVDILTWSRDYSADLSDRLRERVYIEVVPLLAVAVVEQHAAADPDGELNLDALYEETLVLLFRLLFLAYAEDRDLLPYRSNAAYERAALKTTARLLAHQANEGQTYAGAGTHSLWSGVTDLFETVDQGNDAWGVPPYNGGLFSDSADINPAGAAIDTLRLTDEQFAPPLAALLTERDAEGIFGPVDFRSLSVRDFGTIYEGLLESSLSVASSDLTLDHRGNFLPAGDGDEVIVPADGIYHHNRSGARKSSGSYFTKDFAVEHLLKTALKMALDNHIARLGALLADAKEDEAAAAFFDFRCADLAMGSGHFLVAAVDHIETRLAQFLDEHPISTVEAELDRLRLAAIDQLGDSATSYEIERRQLMRRQVARRCVYGVDRNAIAVELARLSLWVHTFVPGLPLSFLDHNLVEGDSLTGIGTIPEAVDYLVAQAGGKRAKHGQVSIFETLIVDWLEQAKEPLIRLGRASDATRAELREVREAANEARERAEPVRKLFDLVCAMRRGEVEPLTMGVSTDDIENHRQLSEAEDAGDELAALHFPGVFPEIFLRERPGFDCLVGNPPWEKLHVERHGFWALRFPGLRGLPVAQQNAQITRHERKHPELVDEYEDEVALAEHTRDALLGGPYPGLGAGHPDLYKAFAWRFLQLTRDGGHIGVVMPRGLLSASGTALWREEALANATFQDVTTLVNNRGWVFGEVHHSFTIALLALKRGTDTNPIVRFVGPYASEAAYDAGRSDKPVEVTVDDFRTWSVGAAFPLLPTPDSGAVFLKLRAAPRFDSGDWGARYRAVQGDLNATTDKGHMIFDPESTDGLWPVYKGGSFNLWTPDTGAVYAWADAKHVTAILQQKRLRQNRTARSAFSAVSPQVIADPATLPCRLPRIAFRDVTRATDSRTVRSALVPPEVILNHKAPYLLRLEGDERDDAYLLGILCSLPLDWYARRYIEISLTFDHLSAFPIPSLATDDPLRTRIAGISARLAAVDDRYTTWATALDGEPSVISPAEREEAESELDALVARAYALEVPDVCHIFETFHVGWDYTERLARTLVHFEAL